MNVNKKLDRLKQWGKERMGAEAKTDQSDEFKGLEIEMQLRHEGMEKLQKSMTLYVQSLSKRQQGDDKEKTLPVAYFGSTMVSHGDDFEPDSEFGQCLSTLGRANERIARMQETYVANATTSWLESLERSLAQMKEYQAARKKLENRRLAYDTSQAKMQKSKKEDFRMEEELRSQKAKYEESNEDVYRRMLDIKEAEVDSVGDLTAFLDAELTYYDRCREVLLQLKREWPASSAPINRTASPTNGLPRRGTTRSRSNTGSSLSAFRGIVEEPTEPAVRPIISSRVPSGQSSPRRELPGFDLPVRPSHGRMSTFEGPTSLSRPESPAGMPRLSRVPTEPTAILSGRSQLRSTKRDDRMTDIFGDGAESGDSDRFYDDRAASPVSGYGSQLSRTTSWSTADSIAANPGGRKMPPPPPPSRSKKPPPPPPLKRSALSTSEVPYA